jgi:hypothetical protein
VAKDRPLDLHAYLVGKLRAATRKWPPFNQIKAAAKVQVTVAYIEKPDGTQWLKATVTENKFNHKIGDEVWVQVYKNMQSRDRVMYHCAECQKLFFDYEYLKKKKGGGLKKTSMTAVDHIAPCVDPNVGFVNWDVYIKRMFEGELQVLCNYPGLRDGVQSCHHRKTATEKATDAERRRKEKAQKLSNC